MPDITIGQMIDRAMIFGDVDGIRIRLNQEESDDVAIVLDCQVNGLDFWLVIPGWRPTPRVSVVELLRDLRTLYDGDFSAATASSMLRKRSEIRTLLTDFNACLSLAQSLKDEQAARDIVFDQYFESLNHLTNWRGAAPREFNAILVMKALDSEVGE